MQAAPTIFKMSGTLTKKDAQDLLTVMLSTMPPPTPTS